MVNIYIVVLLSFFFCKSIDFYLQIQIKDRIFLKNTSFCNKMYKKVHFMQEFAKNRKQRVRLNSTLHREIQTDSSVIRVTYCIYSSTC